MPTKFDALKLVSKSEAPITPPVKLRPPKKYESLDCLFLLLPFILKYTPTKAVKNINESIINFCGFSRGIF